MRLHAGTASGNRSSRSFNLGAHAPAITGQVTTSDVRGFLANIWYELPPR